MKIRVAIVGSGFGLYGLLPAFSRIEECEVVSICGKTSERMLTTCKAAGIGRIYSNFEQMLEKESPDAVAIATPPKIQYTIAKYALSNGIAVFAEKPLTADFRSSQELHKLTKKNKLPNMIDFIFPEIPEWVAAKKIINNQELGKILNFHLNWNFLSYDLKNYIRSWKTDVKMGGGALQFFFSHSFYYMEYFLGRIKKLDCILSGSEKSLNNGESIVDMVILFENGCIGTASLNSSYIGAPKHSLEFQGEHGTLMLQNLTDSVVDNFELIIANGSGLRSAQNLKTADYSTLPSEDSRVKVVKKIGLRFIKWCSQGVPSKPDFSDGVRVQELIELARKSNSRFHSRK